MVDFKSLIFLLVLFFSQALWAVDNVPAICEKSLLSSENLSVIQELQKLKVDAYSVQDRAAHLLLIKNYHSKLQEVAKLLGIDFEALKAMDFSKVSHVGNRALSNKNDLEKFPEHIRNRVQTSLKHDPDLEKVLNWTRLFLTSGEDSFTQMVFAKELENLPALKAVFLILNSAQEYWTNFLKHNTDAENIYKNIPSLKRVAILNFFEITIGKYDNKYLTTLWLINEFDQLDDFPSGIDLLILAVQQKAWNTVNLLIAYGVDPLEEYKNFEDIVGKHQLGVLYLNEIYENPVFLNELLDRGADLLSSRYMNGLAGRSEVPSPFKFMHGSTESKHSTFQALLSLKPIRFSPDFYRFLLLKYRTKNAELYSIFMEASKDDDPTLIDFVIQNNLDLIDFNNENSLDEWFEEFLFKNKRIKLARHLFEMGARLPGGYRNWWDTLYSKFCLKVQESKAAKNKKRDEANGKSL